MNQRKQPRNVNQINSHLPRVFVTSFADLPCCKSSPVHRHPFYELVWVSQGEAKLFVDFHEFLVEPNTMAFIAPGQIHTWESAHEDTRLTIVGFTLEQLAYYGNITQVVSELPFANASQIPFVKFSNQNAIIFNDLFQTIQNRFIERTINHDDVLSAYLNLILVELQRTSLPLQPIISPDAAAQLTHEFRQLVEKHILRHKQVQDYAEMLGVTLNHLVETVRKHCGQTPKQIIQERLSLEAKRLLIHTSNTVAEISLHLDFKTPTYFGSWFKNLEGITPAQFRQTAAFP